MYPNRLGPSQYNTTLIPLARLARLGMTSKFHFKFLEREGAPAHVELDNIKLHRVDQPYHFNTFNKPTTYISDFHNALQL